MKILEAFRIKLLGDILRYEDSIPAKKITFSITEGIGRMEDHPLNGWIVWKRILF